MKERSKREIKKTRERGKMRKREKRKEMFLKL
jgi:hypothetical protein